MLHPQTKALIDLMVANQVPAMQTLTPAEARRVYRERRTTTQPPAPEVGACFDRVAPSQDGPIGLRCYRPIDSDPAQMLPVLVFFHGGGWVIGDLDTHDTLCRQLSNQSGCSVVAVDYRLAPEHPYPAAIDDAYAATLWISQHANELGVDATRLAVGGDSAGGNLAAVTTLLARERGDLPVAFQVLIYPVTDTRMQSDSYTRNSGGYVLTKETMQYYHDLYITDPQVDLTFRASPLLAQDLSHLPPALVLTAGYDPLRDEGFDYANRLSAAGTPCSLVCFERQIHGFILMGKVLDEANSAVSMVAACLRQALKP